MLHIEVHRSCAFEKCRMTASRGTVIGHEAVSQLHACCRAAVQTISAKLCSNLYINTKETTLCVRLCALLPGIAGSSCHLSLFTSARSTGRMTAIQREHERPRQLPEDPALFLAPTIKRTSQLQKALTKQISMTSIVHCSSERSLNDMNRERKSLIVVRFVFCYLFVNITMLCLRVLQV